MTIAQQLLDGRNGHRWLWFQAELVGDKLTGFGLRLVVALFGLLVLVVVPISGRVVFAGRLDTSLISPVRVGVIRGSVIPVSVVLREY